MPQFIAPPASVEILKQRAQNLAGKTIGELAIELGHVMPENLLRKKGWQGQFIELCLGADSGNLSQPDFAHLGIELKTLPIDYQGRVQESTYVCVANLSGESHLVWQQSPVYKKLKAVLWVPIAKNPNESLVHSRIATPFLWRASNAELTAIGADWEAAQQLISLGKVDKLNARLGDILQVRPKAAHSRVLTETVGADGQRTETLPRGFYLRPSFTQALLNLNLKVG